MTALEDLKKLYDQYATDIEFEHMRTDEINFVPGRGVLKPKVMLIGEAPGRVENARAMPFVGPTGQKLVDILKDVEIPEDEVFFTNVVKYWPRDDNRNTRTPTDNEISLGRDYLLQEIEIVNPIYVGLCGLSPLKAIFPNTVSVRSQHGKLLNGRFIPLYHPAVLIYKPGMKNQVYMGYRLLRSLLDSNIAPDLEVE